jgi:hypothetical protein
LEQVEAQIRSEEYASELGRAVAFHGSYDAAIFAMKSDIAYQLALSVGFFPGYSQRQVAEHWEFAGRTRLHFASRSHARLPRAGEYRSVRGRSNVLLQYVLAVSPIAMRSYFDI